MELFQLVCVMVILVLSILAWLDAIRSLKKAEGKLDESIKCLARAKELHEDAEHLLGASKDMVRDASAENADKLKRALEKMAELKGEADEFERLHRRRDG